MGWFLTTGFGVYGWGAPWSGNVSADAGQPDLFVDLATSLERAGFDYMMLEDSSVVPDIFRGTFESSVSRGQTIRHDPLPLVPLLGKATSKLGIIATIATTFYPPFLAARAFSTLDHLTHGRVGVNLVTASPHAAAQNYGLERHLEHDLRYEMADEWVEVVTKLWESWEPGAVVMDEDNGMLADHTKVHTIDHEGRFFKSRGPLNTLPSPQRRPVLCQAGGSPAGKNFGSKHADTIIAATVGADAMRDYRTDISARMIEHGRKPSDCKVLYLVDPVMADTDAEARAKHDRKKAAQAANIDASLAGMSYFTSMDFSKFDLDGPMPDLSKNNGHQSTMQDYAKSGPTLREIASNHRTAESVELVGTPDSVAVQMGEVMEHAGGDGFLIASPVTRKNMSEVTDGLAPALRKRGLIRSDYPYETFRENLLAF